MRSRRIVLVSLGLGIVAACQGASATDLFDEGAAGQLDGSTLGDANTPPPNTSSSSSGAPLEDAGGSSSGGSADAAPDVTPVDPDPTGVFCSEAVGYCTGAAPLCCAGKPGSGALGPYLCKAECLGTETTISCDDDDDCGAGEVCCNTNSTQGVPQAVTCKAAAACPPETSQTKMCDPSKLDTCAAYNPGTTCKQHDNMAPGLSICIP